MTVTIDINPDAVWDDGTPITFADFECTYHANLNTPGSIETAGYDKITSITEGESDKQVVVEFGEVYAPYKDLFRNLIKADVVAELRRRLGRVGAGAAVLGACRTRSSRGASTSRCSCRTRTTTATTPRPPSAS